MYKRQVLSNAFSNSLYSLYPNRYPTLTPVSYTHLIQIGGLGLMTFIGIFYIQGKQKLSLRSRETIQESFSYGETQSLKDFIRSIFLTTFLVEGLGAFLLSFRFIPEFGWGRGMLTSIFLAISAFCNAGFDNFGSTSLAVFQTDPLINLVIAGLIITGGLGFMVWFDLATQFGKKKKPVSYTHLHFLLKLSCCPASFDYSTCPGQAFIPPSTLITVKPWALRN